MQTTIDLPEDLLRAAAIRAKAEGWEVGDLITEWVRQGLNRRSEPPRTGRPHRSEPPVAHRVAASGQPTPALTNAEVAAILDEEDAERASRLGGP